MKDVAEFGLFPGAESDGLPALEAALLAEEHLFFPPGRYLLNLTATDRRIVIPPGAARRMTGDGATFELGNKIRLASGLKAAGQMVTPVAARGTSIESLTDLGASPGDLVHLISDAVADTSWNYKKQCVRRVVSANGVDIELDQMLDFFFAASESVTISVYPPASVAMDGISISARAGTWMCYQYLVDSSIRNAILEGPVPGWSPGWADVWCVASCDRTNMENITFRRSRYSPQIMGGSRWTTVRKFEATDVRHLDCNTWAQDTLFEDGRGVRTDGIIQTHPSIRTTFRRVRDTCTQPGLYGLDLRGLGETVEDCSSAALEFGINTNAPVLRPEYMSWAASYTRIIKKFSSDHTVPTAGADGRFVVENCDTPGVHRSLYRNPDAIVLVDAATKQTERTRHELKHLDLFLMIGAPTQPIAMDLEPTYASAATPVSIAGVSLGQDTVVFAPGHQLSVGDAVYISGMSGPTGLNGQGYSVSAACSDCFTIPINSATMPEYVAGGAATRQELLPTLDAFRSIHTGIKERLWISSKVGGETIVAGQTASVRLKYAAVGTIGVDQAWRHGSLTVRARTSAGPADAAYLYCYKAQSGALKIHQSSASGAEHGISIATTATPHFIGDVLAEGDASWSTVGARHYIVLDIAVALPSALTSVLDLEVEISERRKA